MVRSLQVAWALARHYKHRWGDLPLEEVAAIADRGLLAFEMAAAVRARMHERGEDGPGEVLAPDAGCTFSIGHGGDYDEMAWMAVDDGAGIRVQLSLAREFDLGAVSAMVTTEEAGIRMSPEGWGAIHRKQVMELVGATSVVVTEISGRKVTAEYLLDQVLAASDELKEAYEAGDPEALVVLAGDNATEVTGDRLARIRAIADGRPRTRPYLSRMEATGTGGAR